MNIHEFIEEIFPSLNTKFQPPDLQSLKSGYAIGLQVLDLQIESCQSHDLDYLNSYDEAIIYRELLPAMFDLPIEEKPWQVQHILFLALLYTAKNRQLSLGAINTKETKALRELIETLTNIWSSGLFFSTLKAPTLASLPNKIRNWIDSFDIHQPELASNKKYLLYLFLFINLGLKLMPDSMHEAALKNLPLISRVLATAKESILKGYRENFSSMMATIQRKYQLLETELAPLTQASSAEVEETAPIPTSIDTTPVNEQGQPQEADQAFLDAMEYPSGSLEELHKTIQQLSESYQAYISKFSELKKISAQLTLLSTMLKLESQDPKILLDYIRGMLETKEAQELLSKTLKLTSQETKLLIKSFDSPQKKFNPLIFIQNRLKLRANEMKVESNTYLIPPITISTMDTNLAIDSLAQKFQEVSQKTPIIIESLFGLEHLSQLLKLEPSNDSVASKLENLSLIESNFKSSQEIMSQLQQVIGISEEEYQSITSAYNKFINSQLERFSLTIENFQMPEVNDSTTPDKLIESIKKFLKGRFEEEDLSTKIEICEYEIQRLDVPFLIQTQGSRIPAEYLSTFQDYLKSLEKLLLPVMVSIKKLRALGVTNETLNHKLGYFYAELNKRFEQIPKINLSYTENTQLTDTEKIVEQLSKQITATEEAMYINSDITHFLDFFRQTSPSQPLKLPPQLQSYEDFASLLSKNLKDKIGVIDDIHKGIIELESEGIDVSDLHEKFNEVLQIHFDQTQTGIKLPKELERIKALSIVNINFPNAQNSKKLLDEIKTYVSQIEQSSRFSKLRIGHLGLSISSPSYQRIFSTLSQISKSRELNPDLMNELASIFNIKRLLDIKSQLKDADHSPDDPAQFKP